MPSRRSAPPLPRRLRRRRDRGIALLLILIAIVLISALALEVAQTSSTQSRVGRNAMNDLLLRTTAEGRAHILRAALKYDATNGEAIDTEADAWSWHKRDQLSSWGERSESGNSAGGDTTTTYRNTDVRVQAWCEDERAKLNLQGLSRPDDTAEFKMTRDTLIRLIDEFRDPWSGLDLSEADGREMVDALVDYLRDQAEDDTNPIPPVATGRGKLQSVDDLLRVPGGKWTPALLYDVKDPDLDPDEVPDEDASSDSDWFRANGAPGLARFLTLQAETGANPPLRININTVPLPLLRALFDERDRDLADAIVENRREGADDTEDTTSQGSGDPESGFFTNKSQLTRVDGMADSLDVYPRLNFFADVRSDVYSLYVVATMVTGTIEGAYDAEEDQSDEPRDIVAAYQYHEIVQRVEQGFVSLFRERRQDAILDQ